jgi:hypothetical protein
LVFLFFCSIVVLAVKILGAFFICLISISCCWPCTSITINPPYCYLLNRTCKIKNFYLLIGFFFFQFCVRYCSLQQYTPFALYLHWHSLYVSKCTTVVLPEHRFSDFTSLLNILGKLLSLFYLKLFLLLTYLFKFGGGLFYVHS